jgi:hypothetical protein
MLTQSDKENILKEFPSIKLSYENITHKKVYNSDYIVAIPEGKKCFAWFTSVNDKMVCLIMELINKNNICDIKMVNACFSNDLAYGTILYGTVIYNSHNRFFIIEDIFSYKGTLIESFSWGEKLIKINNMLKNDLKQISYNNSFIVFGLPLMCKTNEELETKIACLNYKIETIQFILFNKVNFYLAMWYKNYKEAAQKFNEKIHALEPVKREEPKQELNLKQEVKPKQELNLKQELKPKPKQELDLKQEVKKTTVFLVRPDIQDDIYNLYCLNNEFKEEHHGIAHIPNYVTSVMMNKLFRVIKENDNLDALEESDDEEEFENENIDKFVYLDKSYKMECQYIHKFKKWIPIKLADDSNTIISNIQLKNTYKFYDQNRKR